MSAMQEPSINRWVDHCAIQDVIFRYSDAVTRGDFEQMAEVFAPDAVWESPALRMRYDRASDFVAAQRDGIDSFDVLVQVAHNPVIRLVGDDTARATTTIHERLRGTTDMTPSRGGSVNVDQYGIYYDELARLGTEWRFVHRLFVPIVASTGTVDDAVVTRRPLTAPAPG